MAIIINKKTYTNFKEILNDETIKASYKNDVSSKEYLKNRPLLLKEFNEYSNKNLTDLQINEFITKLWTNDHIIGLPSCKRGAVIDKTDVYPLVPILAELTHQIAKDNSHKNYFSCLNTLENEKRIKKIPYVMLHRIFIAFFPDKHVDWVSRTKVKEILSLFSAFDDLKLGLAKLSSTPDWFEMSTKIRSLTNSIYKKKNLDFVRYAISYVYTANKNGLLQTKHLKPATSSKRSYTAKDINVELNEVGKLQPNFLKWLAIKGYNTTQQKPAESKGIFDVVATKGTTKYICELKVIKPNTIDESIKARMAIGQLIEYGYWNGKAAYNGFFIVLDRRPSKHYELFLTQLSYNMGLKFNCYYEDRGSFKPLKSNIPNTPYL